MLIEIKKVLKKGIGILLVIILVGVGVTKFKDNKKKKDFLYHDHDSIVAKYGEEGELSKKNLIQIKRLFGNNIEKFELKNYTAREAKMAGFSNEEIFDFYSRSAIVEAYRYTNKELYYEILAQIGRTSSCGICDFKEKGYTAKEAKMAEFSNEEIFRAYSRDAIVEAYGYTNKELDYEILVSIRQALSYNLCDFEEKGYTAKEAKMAGFNDEGIFKVYKRDAIVEAYGYTDKELDYGVLSQIKQALSYNLCDFEEKGYTAKEAKMAGFNDEGIFKVYKRDAIVEAYGYTDKELDYGVLSQIKQALSYNLCDFEEKGYTAKEAKMAGFNDEGIFKVYKRDAIVEAYGDYVRELGDATLHNIKTALYDDANQFRLNGYGVMEARRAGFKDEEIFRAYSRDAIVETYIGENLHDGTLQRIKMALLNNILYFGGKGYTAKEAKMAGFSNEEIFRAYYRNAIIEAYGNNGILNAEALQEIKAALGESCERFYSKGYTEEEARLAGFSAEEISRIYR